MVCDNCLHDEDDETSLYHALKAAKEEFNEELKSRGYDPAYFDIQLRGYMVSSPDFTPVGEQVVIEPKFKSEQESN